MAFIQFEILDSLAVIRMNRPDKLNSFVREMALEMQGAIQQCQSDASVRAVLITGEGRAFCAGQDLAEAISEDGPALTQIVDEHYNPIIELIRGLNKPVVAAVNGVAAGAGANIALACDIVVATQSASFIQAFSAIGLIPDSGGTYTLPRLIGWQKASALMMLGDKISADEAEKMGMIYKVFPDEEFQTASVKLATRLSTMATAGLAFTKQALHASLTNTLSEQLTLEKELQTKAGQTFDYQEGVNAFLEKRKPNYKGK
ncbi:MAG: 2-(1,2-epoxy-1,2-dihydrophenyl)acetyl-CoA isomerase [Flavobacteriales bacterium]|nr:2-(1,2-epoxy-1,2-dihydrophenyl)acetyl-CoA isomerase [Flavobacteriales bacterium]